MLEKETKHMSARRMSRRVGMLSSDLTQCQYLTTKHSIPRHIPMISALEEAQCAWNARDLRNAMTNLSEIQDLRVFDLDT